MSASNKEIKNAIDSFDFDEARTLLKAALKQDPDADTYYLASLVALNDRQKQDFLKKAVEFDPFHKEATDELAKLKPEKISVSTSQTEVKRASLEEAHFVIGSIRNLSFMKKIPHNDGLLVTELMPDSEVIFLTRDEKVEWLNVLYMGSAGRELIGWVRVDEVKDLRIDQQPVRVIDLPITKYEWNTRIEIKELANIKNQIFIKDSRDNGTLAKSSLGLFGTLGLMAFTPLAWIIAGSALGVVIGVISIILIVIGLNYSNEYQRKLAPIQKEVKYLLDLAKTEQDRQFEQQVKLAAINTALQVGGNIITRSVPDRQEITNRNR